MNNKITLTTILMGLSMGLHAQTLSEVVDITLQTSPDVASSIHAKQAVEHELFQSYGGYLPSVDASFAYGQEITDNQTTRGLGLKSLSLKRTDSSLTATQKIFDGFSTRSEVQKALYKAQGASYDVKLAAEEMALNTTIAYLDVLEKQKNLDLAENNLREHQSLLSRIEKRAKSGIGRAADLDQAQGRFALARTNYMSEQANLRDAYTKYQKLVGKAPQDLQLPDVPRKFMPQTQESAVAMALSEHPQIWSASANVSVAAATNQSSYSAFLPSVDFQWTGQRNNNTGGSPGQTKSDSGMLKVNYNLFHGGMDRARSKQAAENMEQSIEDREKVRRNLEERVRLSWSSFTTARQQVPYFQEHVEAAMRTRDAYQKQFAIGQRTLLDLLDSENELYQAQLALNGAQFRTLSGQYQLLSTMGRLVSALDVPLPAGATFSDPGLFGAITEIVKFN